MKKWEMKWDPNTRKTCPETGYQTGSGTKLFKIAERFKIGSFLLIRLAWSSSRWKTDKWLVKRSQIFNHLRRKFESVLDV